ncbi:MAG: GldM family protein [Saprospiraceae bacterium]
MKLPKITVLICILIFFSSCVFMPQMFIGVKKSIDSVKDSVEGLDDIMAEIDSAEIYGYKDDSLVFNEAPTKEEAFDFYDVECIEASLYLDKMNVIYIGVDNPCRIFVTNVPNQHIEIETSDNIEVIEKEGGFYTLRASKPGQGVIYVIAGDYEQQYQIRVKRIPDPVAKLGYKDSGEISTTEFKTQKGLAAWLEDFDFEARCKIASFSLTRITKDGIMETIENNGGRYEEATKILKDKATTGDIYLFENVKQRCPGDAASRYGNSLVFRIK